MSRRARHRVRARKPVSVTPPPRRQPTSARGTRRAPPTSHTVQDHAGPSRSREPSACDAASSAAVSGDARTHSASEPATSRPVAFGDSIALPGMPAAIRESSPASIRPCPSGSARRCPHRSPRTRYLRECRGSPAHAITTRCCPHGTVRAAKAAWLSREQIAGLRIGSGCLADGHGDALPSRRRARSIVTALVSCPGFSMRRTSRSTVSRSRVANPQPVTRPRNRPPSAQSAPKERPWAAP